MKIVLYLSLLACLFLVAPGCDEPGGGSVVENADQAKMDEYLDNQAAMDEQMKAEEAAAGE